MTVGTRRAGHAPVVMASLAIGLFAGCGSADAEGGGRNVANGGYGGAGTGSTAGTNSGAGGLVVDQPMGAGIVASGGAGSGGDMGCASAQITASRIFPTVMLVVDGSTSMLDPYGTPPVTDGGMPDPTALPSRWTSVREALVGADGVVPKLQGLVKFGLAVFGTNATCPLPLGTINPEFNNAMAVTGGLPVQPPGMFTPTGVALDMIVDVLPDPRMVLDGPPIGPQIILLATDGDPNSCGSGGIFDIPVTDYAPSIAAANKATAKGLKMYVIGVGQDAAATHLQEMANIGQGLDPASGGASVYYPEDTAALTSTLEMLIGAELNCDLKLDGKGVKPGKECTGTVMFNGAELECNGPDGFKLIDSTTIQLQGTTCETFKNSVDASVIANFPCDAIIVE